MHSIVNIILINSLSLKKTTRKFQTKQKESLILEIFESIIEKGMLEIKNFQVKLSNNLCLHQKLFYL